MKICHEILEIYVFAHFIPLRFIPPEDHFAVTHIQRFPLSLLFIICVFNHV